MTSNLRTCSRTLRTHRVRSSDSSRENRRRRRQYWRKPSRFSTKRGHSGEKRRARQRCDKVASDGDAIAFVPRTSVAIKRRTRRCALQVICRGNKYMAFRQGHSAHRFKCDAAFYRRFWSAHWTHRPSEISENVSLFIGLTSFFLAFFSSLLCFHPYYNIASRKNLVIFVNKL